jgi:arylsulfatase A-like enzyme
VSQRGAAALLLLAAAGVLGTGCRAQPARAPRPQRIVLVSMDTVRADRVGGFGGGGATPVLREIAREGTRFSRFYAASNYTLPSHAAMLTGLDPAAHGMHRKAVKLAGSPTLAERLRGAGYRTQGFHEGGFVSPQFGFGRGFDEYRRGRRILEGEALETLLAWMREAADEPYFLFVHSYSAHYPYRGHDRYRRAHPERGLLEEDRIRELRKSRADAASVDPPTRALCTLYNQLAPSGLARLRCGQGILPPDFPETPHFEQDRAALLESYDEGIERVDAAIGRMRDLLIRHGQWDDTLFIATSDHGEAFFEHGLYRHGYVPFDEVLHVPLVVSYPRLLRRAGVREVDALTWHLDLAPTILRLAGVAVPPSLTGTDLTPLMLGSEAAPRRSGIFPLVLGFPSSRLPPRRLALSDRFKHVPAHTRFGGDGDFLFDLAADPGERHNLRAARPRDVDALVAEARSWHARSAAERGKAGDPSPLDGLSPEQRRRLQALGYLEGAVQPGS